MKILKLITIFFIIYFIRRFFQMMKALQATNQEIATQAKQPQSTNKNIVDADFKVIN